MSRLLLEIGTEAIPAGYLPPALDSLAARARAALGEARLCAEAVRARGTALRLVLEVEGLAERQEDVMREVQGPRVDAAFRDGKPTPAAEGFARKNGVEVQTLERTTTEKGDFLVARVHVPGRPAAEVLPALLEEAVLGIPWPKTMVWNATRFRFPRPVRWVVCLLGTEVLPVTVAGIAAGTRTRGHRLWPGEEIRVAGAGGLEAALAEHGVILDPALRRERIEQGLVQAAKELGGRVVSDSGLLDEVIYLTEHPTCLTGRFDQEFLSLPREVIVTAMRSHQRYFAVEDSGGALLPNFVVVCDGRWKDAREVVAGNERVLRARLADARFYWQVDSKKGLDALAEGLSGIVWLEAVGTLGEKSERVARLVERLGPVWYPGAWPGLRDAALRAARLAKADLASEMIKDGKEFTGLQGVIGARYAEAAGESPELAAALIEQYSPRGAGDALPQSPVGTLLAFADRLDTVVGCFAAGFVPSGSQDPYGLRRAANGLLRILLEKGLHVSLRDVVAAAIAALPERARREALLDEVLAFLSDRTAFLLRERGVSYDTVDAVLAAEGEDPVDALARAEALQVLRGRESLERLVVGFKRAANILRGIDESSLPDSDRIDWSLAHASEQALHAVVTEVDRALAQARDRKDYPGMLELLLRLRDPIDRFFLDVLVMSENPEERNRRLALLARARGLFHHCFDPARIVIEGEAAK